MVEGDGDVLADIHQRVVTGCGGAGVGDLRAAQAIGRPGLVDVPAEDDVGLLALDECPECLAADVLPGAQPVAGRPVGGACGQKTRTRHSAISRRPSAARAPSSSSGSSCGVSRGESGAADTPAKPTSSTIAARPSTETPSSTSRSSIEAESQFPATARSVGASGRQLSIARSASSGVPNVVMSPPTTRTSTGPVAATAFATASNRPWTSTTYAILTTRP